MIRSAARAPSSSPFTSSMRTANSSPPSLATVSSVRTPRVSRSATSMSTASPERVSVRVVDVLEVVQVRQQQAEGVSSPPGPIEGMDETIFEQGTVGKRRERIVERLMSKRLLQDESFAPVADVQQASGDIRIVEPPAHDRLHAHHVAVRPPHLEVDRPPRIWKELGLRQAQRGRCARHLRPGTRRCRDRRRPLPSTPTSLRWSCSGTSPVRRDRAPSRGRTIPT